MTTDKKIIFLVYMSSLNYVSMKWLLPLWKICNSDSRKTLQHELQQWNKIHRRYLSTQMFPWSL